VNDGGGNDAFCGGIKVRTDTTKLSNMVIASFGDTVKNSSITTKSLYLIFDVSISSRDLHQKN